MSFLSELQKRKSELKETETVVTKVDGRRFVERNAETLDTLDPCYGFVVDTKPDNTPVLVVDNLYIGSQDCAASEVLQLYNIQRVLSLGVGVDVNICSKYVQCFDLPETDIKPILGASLPFIHEAIENNENILIHCNAGVSRTSMVAIAYLIKYRNMTYEDAYALIKLKRPAINPNAGFRKQLMAMSTFKD
ncbi:unnamed protein product [Diatraea saccharalis]|uniref:Dual specificity protein phosphatase 19 n=1 Tax=Diatraea saccharalis TaxID=40085 RepID=A0A9N9QU77_9NEOP|nr:unnamed protein product [Diatraea saccharalis]